MSQPSFAYMSTLPSLTLGELTIELDQKNAPPCVCATLSHCLGLFLHVYVLALSIKYC
jgi:hypothetical protein